MVKPYTNSVEVHLQLSNDTHPVDDGLRVGAGSLRPITPNSTMGSFLDIKVIRKVRKTQH
jgi:hypothetical protein